MKYLAILIVSSALGACAASPTSPPVSPVGSTPAAADASAPVAHGPGMKGGGMMSGGMMGEKCPMEVAGTSVRAEEVEGGAAMIFSTKGDVAELRRRVAAMAEMHSKHPDGCPMMKMHQKAADAPDSPPGAPSDHAAHHPKP